MHAQGHGAGASVTPVAACMPRTKGRSDAADRACRRHRTHPVATWYGACSRWQPQAGCHPHFGGGHVHTVSPAVAQVPRTGCADETVAAFALLKSRRDLRKAILLT